MHDDGSGGTGRYRAFISYSQKDKAAARRLHRWLEGYRVPMGLLGTLSNPSKRRLGRFFRDDEEMAATADIASTVRGAIEDAESLIVICSPRSAQSKWVNAEIQHFRRTDRGGRVFAVIIDGTPNSGDATTECFPLALRVSGDPQDSDAMPIEPLGIDLRKDGRSRTLARLAAGLLLVDFDDLWRRDRRRARSRALVATSLTAVAIVASLVMSAVFVRNAAESDAIALMAAAEEAADNTERALRIGLLAATDTVLSPAPAGAQFALNASANKLTTISAFELPHHRKLDFAFQPTGEAMLVTIESDAPTGRIYEGSAFLWSQDEEGSWVGAKMDAGPKVINARISLDARTIVTVSADGTVSIHSRDSSEDTWTSRAAGQLVEPSQWIRFAPNGDRFLSHSDHSKVQVWTRTESDSWTEQVLDEEHEYKILDAQFSADGRTIVTAAGGDRTGRIWKQDDNGQWTNELVSLDDVAWNAVSRGHDIQSYFTSGRNVHVLETGEDGALAAEILEGHLDDVTAIKLPRTGRDSFLTLSKDGTARMWARDPQQWHEYTDEPLPRLWQSLVLSGHDGEVYGAAFSADDSRIATVASDFVTRLWNRRSRSVTASGTVHVSDSVEPYAEPEFSPDGRLLFLDDDKSRLVLVGSWADRQSNQPLGTTPVRKARFLPDGRRIITIEENRELGLWERDGSGSWLRIATAETLKDPYGLQVSPDGRRIFVIGLGGSLESRTVEETAIGRQEPMEGHSSSVLSVAISADNSVIVTGSEDGILRAWAQDNDGKWSSRILHELEESRLQRFIIPVISPTRNEVLTTSTLGDVRIWSKPQGQEWQSELISESGGLSSATFSPDGNRIIVRGGEEDSGGILWQRTSSGKWNSRTIANDHLRGFGSVGFTDDGRFVVARSGDSVQVISVELEGSTGGEPLIGYDLATSAGFVFAGGGGKSPLLTYGSDGTARLWVRNHTGRWLSQTVAVTEAAYGFVDVELSTDGGSLLAVPSESYDGRPQLTRIWDISAYLSDAARARLSKASGSTPAGTTTEDACSALKRASIRIADPATGETRYVFPLSIVTDRDLELAPTLRKFGVRAGDDICSHVKSKPYDELLSRLVPRALWSKE